MARAPVVLVPPLNLAEILGCDKVATEILGCLRNHTAVKAPRPHVQPSQAWEKRKNWCAEETSRSRAVDMNRASASVLVTDRLGHAAAYAD